MNIKQFTKKYFDIDLMDYQLRWLKHIEHMKKPTIVPTRKGFKIIDKEE